MLDRTESNPNRNIKGPGASLRYGSRKTTVYTHKQTTTTTKMTEDTEFASKDEIADWLKEERGSGSEV